MGIAELVGESDVELREATARMEMRLGVHWNESLGAFCDIGYVRCWQRAVLLQRSGSYLPRPQRARKRQKTDTADNSAATQQVRALWHAIRCIRALYCVWRQCLLLS